MSRYRADDVGLLLPCLQPVIRSLLKTLEALGYKPVPFDTLRSTEEALRNAKRGSGIVDSVHRHGAACDIICDRHGWSCAANECDFYAVLGREARAHGLVWGGDWRKKDLPHVQAVAVADQNALRALSSWEEKDDFVRKRLKR